MFRVLTRRLAIALFTALLSSVIVFAAVRATPGDIVAQMMGQTSSGGGAGDAALREFFGLDRSVTAQYLHWLAAMATGDFGVSWRQATPVSKLLVGSLGVSIELSVLSLLLATLLGIPLGLLAGYRHRSIIDAAIQGFCIVGLSSPAFWVAMLLLFGVSQWLGWSPSTIYVSPVDGGLANLEIMVLPVVSLAVLQTAAYAQFVRLNVMALMQREFVRAARARGIPNARIFLRHILRNLLIPLITFMGLNFVQVLGGVVVIESLFGLPGLGRLLLNAIQDRDYPVVQGSLVVMVAAVIAVNVLVDVLYRIIDPRLEN